MAALKCVVVTPEKAVLDEAADFVVVPMFDGELGVAPGRLPIIGRLGSGELRVTQGGTIKHLFIDGGFVQIRGNVVTLLTPKAVFASDINVAAAQAVLRSNTTATTLEAQDARNRSEQRARVQIRLASKSQ